MAKIINDRLVLDAKESEMLRQNLLYPDLERLSLIDRFYGGIDIKTNSDCLWTVSCPDLNFDIDMDLTIQN